MLVPYGVVLIVHSWLRWAVIGTALGVFARALLGALLGRPWRASDRRWAVVFLSVLDTQILLGLILYFVFSPLTPKSLADLRAFMHVAPLRFFAVEHGTGMLAALVAAHTGWALAKRSRTDHARHRRIAVATGLALLAIAASVPWPWFAYGRPLWRL
jgi:hypothetical protein